MTAEPARSDGPLDPHDWSGMWQHAYQRYYRFWIAQARSTQVSVAEAEDILHAVLACVMEDSGRMFESMDHIRNYVARAVINRAIERRKHDARMEEWDDDSEHFGVMDEEFRRQERDELRLALREGMKDLTPALSQVVKLRFFSGLTFKEMTTLLGISKSTLKSREDAALKRIRKSLRKNGF